MHHSHNHHDKNYCNCGFNYEFDSKKPLGRPKKHPIVLYNWQDIRGEISVRISPQELEAIRLVDKEGLTQNDAAIMMKVSRATVWRLLQNGRKKIINGLLNAKIINIKLEKL